MSGVNNFAGEGRSRNHDVVTYYPTISKKKPPSEKVIPSEEVEKGAIFWMIWKILNAQRK